jgi:hypothetical protein
MKIAMDKNLRTAAAVAVWVALLALSQEAAATGDGVRTDTPVALISRSS